MRNCLSIPSHDTAKLDENKAKNRNPNVLPGKIYTQKYHMVCSD
jgi:hypothetical protein